MTPDRLARCLRVVRWSGTTLAEALDVPNEHVSEWVAGSRDIPKKIEAWVEALCFVHEAAEQSKPATAGEGFDQSFSLERVPVYAYNLLFALGKAPLEMEKLFGIEDNAAVHFLISRGLAVRDNETLAITPEGRQVGEIAVNG